MGGSAVPRVAAACPVAGDSYGRRDRAMRSARFEPVNSPGPTPGAGPAPVMGGPDVEALMAEAVQSGAIPPGADPRALLKEAMQSGTIPPGVDAAAIQRVVMQHAAMRRATMQPAAAARSTPVVR